MTAEALAYPFLFVSIFFEAFVLVTLLSSPARARRASRTTTGRMPSVAVIVPCLNEGETVAATTESLLALDYPKDKLEIVLVDNGSTDSTPSVMARYQKNPQVKILTVLERGKHVAVNAGIAATDAELVGCLDADSFVEPEALKEIVRCFDDTRVAATTAAMSVHKPGNIVQHMQNAEYIFGITLRHVLSSVNGIYVTPGPFSFYRRSVIEELGGFREGHKTEDMEMALRIQRAGHWISNAHRARVYTKAPRTIPALIKQRTRWTTGFLRNVLNEYRDLVGNRRYGALGMIVLPIGLGAIASGILLFCLAVFRIVRHGVLQYEIHQGIPLSYWLLPQNGFDWFYFPSSFYLFLGICVVFAMLVMIAVGKNISRTPGRLGLGLVSYALLYAFVVPFWLMRATADVALGKQRSWR